MRDKFACFCVAVIVSGCAPVASSGQFSKVADGAAPSTNPWQPGEQLITPAPDPNPRFSIKPYREGLTKQGWSYRIHSDNSGRLVAPNLPGLRDVEWVPSCETDAMTDRKSCKLRASELALLLRLTNTGHLSAVCVLEHDFPGERAAVRVDAKPPLDVGETGCVAIADETYFLTGAISVARRVKWPYRRTIDIRGSIASLPMALDFIRHIHFKRRA